MSRLKLFDLMTCVTHCIRTSVTPELGRVLGQEAEDDAMGEDGRGRGASQVCGAGGEREGSDGGAVPGVWGVTHNRVSLAAQVRASGQRNGGGGTQSASGAESWADRAGEGRSCGDVAAGTRLGREKVGSLAAGRRDAADGDHHQPDPETARSGEEKGFA